ncbi:hypothetical protein [Lentzea sp. NPDC055074]
MKLPTNVLKRAGVTAALTAVVALGGGVLAAAPASAAAGILEICSKGTYATSVAFPDQSGSGTVIIPSGSCGKIRVGTSTRVENIHVFGHVHHAKWLVTTGHLRPSIGGIVVTWGTPQRSSAMTPAL